MTWDRRPKELSEQSMGVTLPSPRKGSLRHQTFVNQGGLCYYCGQPTPETKWTKDHRTPRCLARNRHGNVVGCCWPCNHAKGRKTEAQFLATSYLPLARRIALGFKESPEVRRATNPTTTPRETPRTTRNAYWIRIGDGSLMRTIA